MPALPYPVTGTVYKGPHQGISIITKTVDIGLGGDTVDIYVSNGSELALSQTVTLKHTSSSETLTATTDSVTGGYTFDLADLASYSDDDEYTVTVDTRSNKVFDNQAIAKTVAVDRQEKIHDENYPLPVVLAENLISHPFVQGNVQRNFTITRSDGQPDREIITFADGRKFYADYSYNAAGRVTQITKWQKL